MVYSDILYKTYELKINGRNEYVASFHKWMTFYCVAIGAILVAFCQFQSKVFLSFLLVGFGLITSFLFHLSCKGYKHWNDYWIEQIKTFEGEIENEVKRINPLLSNESLEKYKVYYKQAKYKAVNFYPLDSAKISTPKVTLAFSFTTYFGWLIIMAYQLYKHFYTSVYFYQKPIILLSIAFTVTIHIFLFWVSPQKLYSDEIVNIK